MTSQEAIEQTDALLAEFRAFRDSIPSDVDFKISSAQVKKLVDAFIKSAIAIRQLAAELEKSQVIH